jgi:4-hydroxy-2-oxoheptanedioate aldolase
MPINQFKAALKGDRALAGCWLSLCSNTATEICAGAGFDWVLIDTEHAANELFMVQQQLQVIAGYPVPALVRPAWNDTVAIKRYLDLGVQTLLIPYVETPEEAARAVAATRYAPQGVRGVSTNSRANRYGRVPDYFKRVHDEMCLLVQLESRKGLDNLEAIAAIDGVDGIFIGPQDFAADFGHLANPGHPEVRAAIADAITRINKTGKASGILSFAEADAKGWIAHGAKFVAVTSDQFLLARNSEAVVKAFRG